jgi:hypothetical protein
MWATKGEGEGSWIQVDFRQKVKVTSFRYQNRNNAAEDNKEIILSFSDS